MMLPQATISEHEGVRYLHLGSPWVQGAMRLSEPWKLELEYIQQMMLWTLFTPAPEHIVQLGLGAASLTKFCYKQFPNAHISAIELNPEIVRACHLLFELPPNDARLQVQLSDAHTWLDSCVEHARQVDILQVDLYSDQAEHPALESSEFYQACAHALKPDGILTVNILGSPLVHARNIHALQTHFEAVAWLPETHDGNIVAIAFKQAPSIDFDQLYERANTLQKTLGLPASTWVDGLLSWMQGD